MRDIFGIAVAVLVGLITLAFQPWTAQWWTVVIISGAIALVTAAHAVWRGLPDQIRNRLSPATWTPEGKVVGGKLRAVIGILIFCTLLGSGYVASRWPFNFLRPPSDDSTPPELTGPITSRLNHFILSCDVPPSVPANTTTDWLWELHDYKQKLDVLGDAMGIVFTMETIRGGVRIEAEAATDEAKQRILPLSSIGVTKFTFEIRRLDKIELVSVIVKLPPQLAFYGWIPPNPAAPDTILVVRWTEHFFGFKTGICHLI